MNSSELQQCVERLKQGNTWEQMEVAWTLARSGDPQAVAIVLGALEQPDFYHPEVISNIINGLAEGAPATLEPIISYLERSPFSPGGRDCATVLGEVAYQQGLNRDPRIVPALLRALTATLARGTRAASAVIAALRECARAAPLQEGDEAIRGVLSVARREEDPYLLTLDNALEALYTRHGDRLLEELRSELQTLPARHSLRIAVEEFLAAKSSG